MNFIGRINLPGARIPTRGYLHKTGAEAYAPRSPQLFARVREGTEQIDAARDYLQTLLSREGVIPEGINYIIAILWGNEEKEKVIDCFGFSGIEKFPHWPGNPEVRAWVLINGVYSNSTDIQREITCGDGIIILGQEEAYRRRCTSLEEYIQNPPEILDPKRVSL